MTKLNKDDYNVIAMALSAKGYTAKDVYPVLESAGFKVSIKGKTYRGIYASRIIALMYEREEDKDVLEL